MPIIESILDMPVPDLRSAPPWLPGETPQRERARLFGLIALLVALLLGALLTPGAAKADDCRAVTVLSPAPMLGNNDEILELSDGTTWRVRYEFAFLFKSFPSAKICPNAGVLVVAGKSLRVERLYPSDGGGRPPGDRDRPGWPAAERSRVVIADDECGRFLALDDRYYYVLDWIRGPFPREDDVLTLEVRGARSGNARYRLDDRSGWASLAFVGTSRREAVRAFSRRCGR